MYRNVATYPYTVTVSVIMSSVGMRTVVVVEV
jgi:hypothetical protein